MTIKSKMTALLILLCIACAVSARNSRIASFDFRETPLSDVFKVFTLQTGKNVISSPDIKDMPVTLYLENVTSKLALETLCKTYGLWYTEDRNVVRVMRTDEFSKGLAFGRDEHLRHLPLRYASSISIAEIIAGIYGDRIKYALPESYESFSHVGTDKYPEIGKEIKLSASADASASASSKTKRVKGQHVIGGIEATNDDIQRAINTIGTVDVDSMMSRRIGQARAYMTVSLRDNSIIMRSVDENLLADVADLIRRLDTPTKQVLLEMKILEVNLGDDFESFVDLNINPGGAVDGAGNLLKSLTGLTGIETVNRGALNSSSFKMGYVNDIVSYKMELFEKENRVKKIGSPLMLCANNASGKFFQGVSSPLRKGYSVTTLKNNEGFITNEYVEVKTTEEDVGVTLEISPSINEDKTVALKIVAEISSILLGQGPEIPYSIGGEVIIGQTDVVRKTMIQDIVVAQDAQHLALGGLIEESEVDIEKKVPVLGDIPLLGFFFKSSEKSKERKEIIFLIRPHIITSPMEGESVNTNYFSRHSEHPYYKDTVQTLLVHDDNNDVVVSTVKQERKRTAQLLEKNRDEMIDSIKGDGAIHMNSTILENEDESLEGTGSSSDKNPKTAAPKNDSTHSYRNKEYKSVHEFLKEWARVWSNCNIDDYMQFYSKDFSGKGKDRKTWKADKKVVFEKHEDVTVNMRGLNVLEKTGEYIQVQFFQIYKSLSYCDITQKTMVVKQNGSKYEIIQEDAVPFSENPVPCENITDIENSLEIKEL